jgi:predicted phage-related endonuclease
VKIINCQQGTDEWFLSRLGVPSASCFDKIVTMKGEPSKQAEKYLFKLAGEKVSGKAEETYQNDAMKRGVEMEDQARQLYQILTDTQVEQVGFCVADGGYGCSPDGLVGEDGMIEIKCPSIAVHVEYLLGGKLPSDYFQQCQGQLLVTGRKWSDFVSFYPGLKPLIVRVTPDEKFITALRAELEQFCVRLNETINKIK